MPAVYLPAPGFAPMKIAPLLLSLLLLPAIGIAGEDVRPPLEQEAAVSTLDQEALNNLLFYALSLTGTPYKFGGSSPLTGFDCSGFVRHVFHETLGVQLPRSSKAINTLGTPVSVQDLRPGDLVFYNTMRHAFSHVGIYLGDHRFVHAPSSGGGIRIESTTEPYWTKRFDGARRISFFR